MSLPIFDEKGWAVYPNSDEFYDFDPGDWSNFYQQTSPQPIGNTTQPTSPGEGFAWFGEAGGEGRWSIDTESDYWDKLPKFKEPMPNTGVKGEPNLPGWFQGSFDPETGRAYGSNYSGGRGWLSQGGDLTAEHYGQPGSWSWTPELRPDGSTAHVVGDVYWDGDWGEAQEGPAYYSDDPGYQEQLSEQKGRMRSKIMDKILAGDEYAPQELLSWDQTYGQKDLAGGKHFTQDIEAEAAATARQQQLRQQKEGVVRGTLETDRANKGMTLAQRLQSNLPTVLQNQPNYTAGEKISDFFKFADENRDAITPTALEYGGNIIKSAFQGGDQVTRTDFRDQDVQRLFEDAAKHGSRHIPINAIEKPFSDEHMYAKDGVLTPHTAETREKHGDIAKTQAYYEGKDNPLMNALGKIQYGFENPLGARGKSYLQYVDSGDGKPTAVFSDAAYLKKNSKDPNDTTGLQGKIGSLVDKFSDDKGLSSLWHRSPQTELGKTRSDNNIVGTEYGHTSLPYDRWSDQMRLDFENRQSKAAKGSTYNQALDRNVLTIAGKGGSPGQPYDAPKDDPTNPWVPAPKRDKLAGNYTSDFSDRKNKDLAPNAWTPGYKWDDRMQIWYKPIKV